MERKKTNSRNKKYHTGQGEIFKILCDNIHDPYLGYLVNIYIRNSRNEKGNLTERKRLYTTRLNIYDILLS